MNDEAFVHLYMCVRARTCSCVCLRSCSKAFDFWLVSRKDFAELDEAQPGAERKAMIWLCHKLLEESIREHSRSRYVRQTFY